MISNDNNKYSIYVYPVYSLVNMGLHILMLKIYNDNLLFWSDNSASRVVVFYIFARETNHYALVSLQRSIYRQVTS